MPHSSTHSHTLAACLLNTTIDCFFYSLATVKHAVWFCSTCLRLPVVQNVWEYFFPSAFYYFVFFLVLWLWRKWLNPDCRQRELWAFFWDPNFSESLFCGACHCFGDKLSNLNEDNPEGMFYLWQIQGAPLYGSQHQDLLFFDVGCWNLTLKGHRAAKGGSVRQDRHSAGTGKSSAKFKSILKMCF